MGYDLKTTGYGGADISIVTNVVFGNQWMCLNQTELGKFYAFLKKCPPFSSMAINGTCEDEDCGDSPQFFGKFEMMNENGRFNIIYRGEEGEFQRLNGLTERDVIDIISLNLILEGRQILMTVGMRSLVDDIESKAYEYRRNIELLRDLISVPHYDERIVELVVNHSIFLGELIYEINEQEA